MAPKGKQTTRPGTAQPEPSSTPAATAQEPIPSSSDVVLNEPHSPSAAATSAEDSSLLTSVESEENIPSAQSNPTSSPSDALLQMLLDSVNEIRRRLDGLESQGTSHSPASETSRPPHTLAQSTSPSTPTHHTRIPPHLLSQHEDETSDPSALFQRMPLSEQEGMDAGLRRLGVRFDDVVSLARTRAPPSTSYSPAMSRSQSVPATQHPSTPRTTQASTTTTAPYISIRAPMCKPEFIGKFQGDPTHLENFLSRVRAVARVHDDNSEWVMSVIRTLPIVMEGDAAVWHAGLTDEEAAGMTTLTVWQDKLREAFPVNKFEQRRNARNRQWIPADEGASAYFFYKLRLLRGAYGPDQDENNLTHDILDGLPPSFRVMLRLPRHHVTLNDVRQEISEWEPTWRELNGQPRSSTAASSTRTVAATPTSKDARLFSSSTSYSRPASSTPRTTPSSAPKSSTPYVPLAVSYDPSRIIPASNGQPRKYRRPDNNKVIDLDRACDRCGEHHFNFEHEHLQNKAQARVTHADDDYPEAEDDEDEQDSPSFVASETT
ncbi:hypothetical protein CF319_g8167 [Tilletia indica]|uniref:Uncharacterized protein n=1 Tax=Tilletia indica TaxID=43049 RepID=A0A177T582_9BASI|nr:hypothetical protein CF319_g8167 [Tilletia indica]KAE8228132.1 hypothetical protein CF326_g6949 [Tilletia indica]KAE8250121.1 hypothetical protein A4X13_0g4938 [Tilletia indica]